MFRISPDDINSLLCSFRYHLLCLSWIGDDYLFLLYIKEVPLRYVKSMLNDLSYQFFKVSNKNPNFFHPLTFRTRKRLNHFSWERLDTIKFRIRKHRVMFVIPRDTGTPQCVKHRTLWIQLTYDRNMSSTCRECHFSLRDLQRICVRMWKTTCNVYILSKSWWTRTPDSATRVNVCTTLRL